MKQLIRFQTAPQLDPQHNVNEGDMIHRWMRSRLGQSCLLLQWQNHEKTKKSGFTSYFLIGYLCCFFFFFYPDNMMHFKVYLHYHKSGNTQVCGGLWMLRKRRVIKRELKGGKKVFVKHSVDLIYCFEFEQLFCRRDSVPMSDFSEEREAFHSPETM